MIKSVYKKDGRRQKYKREKLVNSILQAFESAGDLDSYAEIKANKIADSIESAEYEKLTAEELGNLVEKGLMSCKRKDAAKAYILYRDERTRMRGNTTDKTINEIINGTSDYWSTENSNKAADVASTQRDYLAGTVSEDLSRRQLLPTDIVEAHDQGIIHMHDLDYFVQKIHNCCLVNLEDMLQNGTVINKTLIEKPHAFSTACTIATQIMACIASGQYGGQTINLYDLVPFVEETRKKYRKEFDEEIVEKLVRQDITSGIQTMQYQINTLNTSNGQTPFASVYMYLKEAPEGKLRDDFAMVIEEVLKQRMIGTKNEAGVYVTPAFPKLLYVLTDKSFDKNDKYYYLTELAAKCTAKRMVPDYISEKMMLEYKNDVYGCMGCRSFLTPDRWSEKYGNLGNAKNFEQHKGHVYHSRFNQGVVTLNLVDIGLSANKDLNKFWEIFEERTELCHKALRCRHERLLGTPSDISPIHWQYGGLARLAKGEKIDKLLYHGYSTLSLGYAGLWECVYSLIGKKLTEPEGESLGLEIMQKLNDKCNMWKDAEDIDYSLYGTPLESTTNKFAKKLKQRFGVVKGVTDKDYITNSYHIHVTEEIDPFDKLAIEAKFQKLSPGGAISYIETSNLTHNIEAVLQVMEFIYNTIMYAELNTKSDYCQACGFDGEIQVVEDNGRYEWECPNCKNRDKRTLHVARRTCGYIGSNFWNFGRTAEIKDRYVHLDNYDS